MEQQKMSAKVFSSVIFKYCAYVFAFVCVQILKTNSMHHESIQYFKPYTQCAYLRYT
jgi:hypothetical protein